MGKEEEEAMLRAPRTFLDLASFFHHNERG